MLDAAHVAELAEAAAAPDQPRALLRAVERVASVTLRHSLFTVTRFDERLIEVERLYSSHAGAYPVGGRKKKRDTPWGEHVLIAGKAFVGEGEEAIRAAFDDHALILGHQRADRDRRKLPRNGQFSSSRGPLYRRTTSRRHVSWRLSPRRFCKGCSPLVGR